MPFVSTLGAHHEQLLNKLLAQHEGLIDDRRARLLGGFLIYGITLCFFIACARFLTQGAQAQSFIGLANFLVLSALLYYLYRTGDLNNSADLSIVLILFAIVMMSTHDGGLYSRACIWFMLLPILASFLGGRIKSKFCLGLVLGSLTLLFALHQIAYFNLAAEQNGELAKIFSFFLLLSHY